VRGLGRRSEEDRMDRIYCKARRATSVYMLAENRDVHVRGWPVDDYRISLAVGGLRDERRSGASGQEEQSVDFGGERPGKAEYVIRRLLKRLSAGSSWSRA
jgi:hypothetical protein